MSFDPILDPVLLSDKNIYIACDRRNKFIKTFIFQLRYFEQPLCNQYHMMRNVLIFYKCFNAPRTATYNCTRTIKNNVISISTFLPEANPSAPQLYAHVGF